MPSGTALVIFRKQLGDLLLLQPGLELLSREQHPVFIHTRPGFADLLSLMPGHIQLFRARWPKADHVYCLEGRSGAMLYAGLALGARKSLLLTRYDAPWWQRLIFDEYKVQPGRALYTALAYYQLFGGDTASFRPPRLNLPPPEWLPDDIPSDYILIHPTAAWKRKSWPAVKWLSVLRQLQTGLPWLITSGSSSWEMDLAREIAEGLPVGSAINLAGKTNLRQYMALTAKARATLCIDGSASHLSAAFGRPTLTLFGPTNAARWYWPHAHNKCLKATDFSSERKPAVAAIPESAVLTSIRELLAHELPHE